MRHLLLIAIILLAPLTSLAAVQDKGAIVIEHPWARPTFGTLQTGVVYMTLVNKGKESDVLVAVSTPVAAHASIHATLMREGVMRMLALDNLSLPAGQNVTFAPGGLHIMLTGITHPLQKGEHFPLTLVFQKAGAIEVQGTVE